MSWPWSLGNWMQMANAPYKYFDKPILIHPNEFVIVPEYTSFFECDVFCKYNLKDNLWYEWIGCDKEINLRFHTSALNRTHNLLYISNSNDDLLKINLDTKKHEVIASNAAIGGHASSIIIDNTFHIIGGKNCNKHLLWNDSQNSFTIVHEFKEFDDMNGFCFHGLVHMRYKLILFGGLDQTIDTAIDDIFVYDLNAKEWNALYHKLPQKLYSFGYITTRDNKFLIMFGGINVAAKATDQIYVLDANTMQCIQCSPTVCPSKGFIRRCWSVNSLGAMRFPAASVYEIIKHFNCEQFVHLFQRSNGSHWKINLKHILKSIHQ